MKVYSKGCLYRNRFAKKVLSFVLLLLLTMPLGGYADEEVSLFTKPTATPEPAVAEAAENVSPENAGGQESAANEAALQLDGSVLITISAGGDLTFGDDVRKGKKIFEEELKRHHGDLSFVAQNVRDILQKDDLSIVNFETNLTTAPVYKKNNDYVFSAPLSYVEILHHFGIEAVSYENNHAMDHGTAGIEETQKTLTEAGITWSTEAHPAVYETKGVRIGILAYQTFNYHYRELRDIIPQDIASMRQRSDIIIVSVHWGREKDYVPNEVQTEIGRLAVDAGADLVMGHHSHRINPIEEYNGKYIAYSLGNFCFSGNSNPSDMSSFILQVRFSVKDGQILQQSFRIIPMRISSKKSENDFIPTPYTEQRQIDTVINTLLSNSKKLPYAVKNYPLDWE